MRRQTLATLTALAALSLIPLAARADSVSDAAPSGLAIGQSAPMKDLKLKNANGADLSIADAAGKKGTLVMFICNHCPWVKAWQGRIASVGNAAAKRGVGVIAINSNDPAQYAEDGFDDMKARAKSVGYKFPYVMDETSEVGRAFGATHTPEIYLFDAQGKLVYHGAVDDNAKEESAVQHRYMKDAVEAVAAGKTVPVAETKALGCGIKLREKAAKSSS